MADEAPKTETAAPEASKAQEPKPEAQKMEAPKMEAPKTEAPAPTPKPEPTKADDPTLSRLFSAEKRIEELTGALEAERQKIKTFERNERKGNILGSLYDAFPGLSRDEIRGAALVAQEDGKVDLYSSEGEKQVEALKELLKGKVKPSGPTTTPAPAPVSLGGTPGAPAKPPTSNGLRSGPRKWGI